MKSLVLLSFLPLVLAPWHSVAQEAPAAAVSPVEAVAYAPITPGAAFATQAQTTSKTDEDALSKAAEVLAAEGYRLDANADLVLTVETSLSDKPGDAGSPFNYQEESAGVRAGGNIFSSAGGSLINPGIPTPRYDRTFRVAISVYERESGHYLWRGSIERLDPSYDPSQALAVMVPELLRYLGTSILTAQ